MMLSGSEISGIISEKLNKEGILWQQITKLPAS